MHLLNDLKVQSPNRYKLYQLALWLNSESSGYVSLQDDIDKQGWIITDLKTITTPEAFTNLLTNYDIWDPNQKSPIDGATLKDVALGLAGQYLIA
jgi:hypothetical protein